MATKKASRKAAGAAAGADEPAAEESPGRVVKFVVNRPYSAGEAYDIVDAQVVHEYEDGEGVLRLKLIDPPPGVDEDQKRVRRSDRREVGTWFEEPVSEEGAADGDEG